MSLRLSKGQQEAGIVVGNTFDKYTSGNPLVRRLMGGFHSCLDALVTQAAPRTIHEVGCGEGYWTLRWHRQGYDSRGCDFSQAVIDLAQVNAVADGAPVELFRQRSIYDLDPSQDGADLLVCCEVLEHLEDPQLGLAALRSVVTDHLIISVPREPLWRILNLCRGEYIPQFGNTPGHLQHWSKRGFVKLLSPYFEVLAVRSPLPWTMALCRPRS
jgi:2-polyprenyl-3-methyl-5-hydroxy-6-metoxy-1,4-benzoquinol methylase